jgi:hypothetical protein
LPTLVEQLQIAASDSNTRVSDLLRRAKVVASKLKQSEMLHWVDSELGGQFDESAFPEYRRIPTMPVYRHPYHGYQPFVTSDSRINATFSSSRPITTSIGELESLVATGEQSIYLTLPESIYEQLARWGVDIRPLSQISRSSISGILDAVRTGILDWALKLESMGILGTETSFTADERARADKVPMPTVHIHGNITNFSGVIGSSEGIGSYGATQSQTGGIDVASALALASRMRQAAQTLPRDEAFLAESAADSIEDGAKSPGTGQSRLKKALAFGKALLPKLGTFVAKTALEAEFTHLLGG